MDATSMRAIKIPERQVMIQCATQKSLDRYCFRAYFTFREF
jgi:hypothetical protein